MDNRDFYFWQLGSDGRACPACFFPLERSSDGFCRIPPSSHLSHFLFLRQPHIPTLTSASLSVHSLLHRQPFVLIFLLILYPHCCLSSVSFCISAYRASRACIAPDTRALEMNPQFYPVFPAIPPLYVYGHFLASNNPYLLLIYVLAAHDIELDYERMARFSRQQLDVRLWMSSADQVAAGMQHYVNRAQYLRHFVDSGVQNNAYEGLQRRGYDISNLLTPPPIIESSPENAPPHGNQCGAAPGSMPGSQGYSVQGTERFVGLDLSAMYPANEEHPWYNPHLNSWTANTVNYWVCPVDENTFLHQPTPVKLPNDPLRIVESIERDDITQSYLVEAR